MEAVDHARLGERIDTAFRAAGLLLHAAIYTAIAALADHCDFGGPMLTGVLAGDLLGRLLALAWDWRENAVLAVAELALLGLVYVCVRRWLVWPEDPAMRAVLGLAGFGTFTARFGSTWWRRARSEEGFL